MSFYNDVAKKTGKLHAQIDAQKSAIVRAYVGALQQACPTLVEINTDWDSEYDDQGSHYPFIQSSTLRFANGDVVTYDYYDMNDTVPEILAVVVTSNKGEIAHYDDSLSKKPNLCLKVKSLFRTLGVNDLATVDEFLHLVYELQQTGDSYRSTFKIEN